jgi:DNA-binding NarL/FixJ family response regulator
MIHLSLYTKEAFLAKGLESELRQAGGFEVLPLCGTLAGLTEQIKRHTPDLALLDLSPEVTFAVLSDMKRTTNSKIVLWVDSISADLAFQAISLGVRGVLRKTLPPELHVKCLRKVQAGELWFEKALIQNFARRRRVALTPGERQLVSLLSQGLKNGEIAGCLMVSEGFVKVCLSRLFQKIGVKNRFELALFGLKNLSIGLLPSEEAPEGVVGAASGQRLIEVEMPDEPVGFAVYPTTPDKAAVR